ncbi:MAG: YvcK family protein [Candidatus Atribacteria bacterium]|nr:YvcK family protein [Candidatus Atribacteria bacterium]
MSMWKWLYPGMRVKRFLLIVLLGITLMAVGLIFLIDLTRFLWIKNHIKNIFIYYQIAPHISGFLLVILGSSFVILGISNINRSILKRVAPLQVDQLSEIIYMQKKLEKGPKIVVIGGGTGLNTLLRGLKQYTSNITAIVTVFDSGGSSGQLRNELGVLPPGDIRNCLVALSTKEPLMTKLFQYRFKNGSLHGHSFGNLFITAMTEVSGDFAKAIEKSSEILAIRGKVLPSSIENVTLCAQLKNKQLVKGENNISKNKEQIESIFIEPSRVLPFPEAIQSISDAEVIILGPGSLYTSVICNLLVENVPEVICQSKAIKIYVCNVMTQLGETDQYTASMHLKAVIRYLHKNCLDYAVVNRKILNKEVAKKYQEEGAYSVKDDLPALFGQKTKIIRGELLSDHDFARHDSDKIASLIIDIIHRGRK